MVFPPSNPNLTSCGPVLALILKRAPALSRSWRVCRNGRRCVYSVWAFFGCLSDVPTRRVSPLSVHISAMSEDCSLQVRTGAGPPRRRRRPKRRCKGLSDMSMPMPKNVARRAGARIQIQREPTSCVLDIGGHTCRRFSAVNGHDSSHLSTQNLSTHNAAVVVMQPML